MYNSGVTSQTELEVPIMNALSKQDAATPPSSESTRLIPLTQGKFAIVDAADFDWLNQWKWYAALSKKNGMWYAQRGVNRNGKITIYRMHRLILNAPRGVLVDHRDGNGLNNIRTNIRLATSAQNQANTGARKNSKSGIKGVHFYRPNRLWRAQMSINRRVILLGQFKQLEDAEKCYRNAVNLKYQEFSYFTSRQK